MTRTNALIGFLVAPLMPGLAILAYAALYAGNRTEGLLVFFFGSVIAYAATLCLGVPMFLLLRWLRLNGSAVYVTAGAAIGIITYFVLAPSTWTDAIWASDLSHSEGPHLFLAICAIAGFIAALVFWLVVRPDREFTPQ